MRLDVSARIYELREHGRHHQAIELFREGKTPTPHINAHPQQVAETYYNFPVPIHSAALDVEYIDNPGYNRPRGPVVVLRARLHVELEDPGDGPCGCGLVPVLRP